jgi:hypothetical protein
MIVFEWLKDWFEDNGQLFEKRGITFSFSKLQIETDKPGQYVDIYSQKQLARVSLWETGECDLEIIDDKTGAYVSWENRTIESKDELAEFFDHGFSKL